MEESAHEPPIPTHPDRHPRPGIRRDRRTPGAGWVAAMPGSPIIVMNGTSSAGKTSIGVQIQQLMPEPYLLVGLDHFVLWLPRRYFNLEGDGVDELIYEPTPDRLTEDGRFP